MFFTGSFSLDGFTCQRAHEDDDPWNDDVLSWIDNNEFLEDGGYVSNIGDIATIHIRNGYLAKDITFIKTIFGLYSEHGINQVEIVPFDGWQNEIKKRNN